MRRILVLTSAVVFFDTLFFTALTPLLPHYVHTLHLGKTGAGVLAAAYPFGTFLGAIPSGLVATRLGPKRTVLGGLTVVAVCIILFGVAGSPWQIDLARFLQGLASSFSWTGALAWLVASAPADRRGTLIGTAFAAAAAGALFGPAVGGIASTVGIAVTFAVVGTLSLGLAAFGAATPAERPAHAQPLAALWPALADRRVLLGFWLVTLPALLFGTLSVLAPLRLSKLGFGSLAIAAVFLTGATTETLANLIIGRAADRHGPLKPARLALAASVVVAALLPWPNERFELAALTVAAALAFGTFFTPGMTMLAHAGSARGLDYGWTFALVNLAWAPGQAIGAAGGGALAHATRDAVPYLVLSSVCAITLITVRRLGSARAEAAGRQPG